MTVRIAMIINPETGEIKGWTSPGNEADLPEGILIGADQIRWTDQFGGSPTNLEKTHRFDLTSETFVERAAKPEDSEHLYNWTSHAWEFDSDHFWSNVRAIRDLKLGMSDWTQGSDSPLTAEKKAEWATYRQAVRDVPADNTSVTVYGNIVWPTEPS